jgi:hypothetical protein
MVGGKNTTGACELCRTTAELRESHVIPKFAIRWMKETGTGYIRRVAAANIRLQDGAKRRMLCGECEQRFSGPENYFAAEVFRPFLSGARSVVYDARLTYFVVSLLWRALQRERNEAADLPERPNLQFAEAQAEWREFLLGRTALQRFPQFHLFIADIAVANPPGVPNFNLYCARAFDATFFELEGRCYVVSKFARFFFVALLTPGQENDWIGTRIDGTGGTLSIPQEIRDGGFGGWLMARAKFAYEKFASGLSYKQSQAIEAHGNENAERIQNSDLFRVAMADHLDDLRIRASVGKIGRNDACPCGSGRKFKKCHGRGL